MDAKVCTQCKRTLPLSGYHRNCRSPDGLQARCKECQRAANRASYQKHKESWKPTRAAWVAENRERQLELQRRWLAEHPERARYHWQKRWNEKRAEVLAYQREWNRRNRGRLREMERRYHLAHPHYAKIKNERRRARLAQVRHDLTSQQWREILEFHDHRCAYCLRHLTKLTIDHVVPISRGGEHTADNVVPACQSCNSKKGNRPVWVMLDGNS